MNRILSQPAGLRAILADITTLAVDATSTPPIRRCWAVEGWTARFTARQGRNQQVLDAALRVG